MVAFLLYLIIVDNSMATIYNDNKEILEGGYQMKVDRLVSIIMILLEVLARVLP
ncbi:hypothetical protein LQZ18_15645 [Lachnospiraceae bacterium ZAX-1]